MNLTDAQKKELTSWLEAGDSLSDIQKYITEKWDKTLTYMEVRFLVDDLDLDLKDPEEEKKEEPKGEELATEEPEVTGAVTVSVDKVMRPGASLSGSATFSDGVSATWQVDQMGRIGILPSQEGYQPTEEDLQEFQKGLQAELQRAGFA